MREKDTRKKTSMSNSTSNATSESSLSKHNISLAKRGKATTHFGHTAQPNKGRSQTTHFISTASNLEEGDWRRGKELLQHKGSTVFLVVGKVLHGLY